VESNNFIAYLAIDFDVPSHAKDEEPKQQFIAGVGTSILYRSCNRTKTDDEFLMVRCVLNLSVISGTSSDIEGTADLSHATGTTSSCLCTCRHGSNCIR
jgi:hypothetical protein